MATLYEWYEVTRDARGKERRRKLRYRMTLEEAAADPRELEQVPGSVEERGSSGGYLGWGQALQDDAIAPPTRFGDKWEGK